jgi:hypothetical protein
MKQQNALTILRSACFIPDVEYLGRDAPHIRPHYVKLPINVPARMTSFPFGGGCPALPLNLTEAAHLCDGGRIGSVHERDSGHKFKGRGGISAGLKCSSGRSTQRRLRRVHPFRSWRCNTMQHHDCTSQENCNCRLGGVSDWAAPTEDLPFRFRAEPSSYVRKVQKATTPDVTARTAPIIAAT